MSQQAQPYNLQADAALTEIEGCINLPQLFRKRCQALGSHVLPCAKKSLAFGTVLTGTHFTCAPAKSAPR